MRLRIGNTRLRIGNVRLAVGSGSAAVTPPAPAYASTFTTALSPTGGQAGTMATYVVTPGSAGFPAGVTVLPVVTGFSTPGAKTPPAGSATPLTFVLLVTGAAGSTAIANVSISGMTNQSGAQQFAIAQAATPITPSTPTGAGNRFDLVLDRSAAAPGDTVNGLAIINGLWPTASGRTIVLSNGIVVSMPTTGSAPATFSFTAGSAGELSLSATNNAGLYNPYPAPLTIFSAGAGSAQSLTASLTRLDQVTFQRDTASGNPTGFSLASAKGWFEAWFNVSQGGPALFARLHDAKSSGASGTVGTGTALTGIVQVHGAFSAGVVRVLLPASLFNYYADLATDAAFTNPVRVAQRFRGGVVVAPLTRSYKCGIARQFADSSAFPAINTNVTTLVAGDSRFGLDGNAGGNSSFFAQGVDASTKVNGDSEGWTSGAEEMGRLLEAQLGVAVSICGMAAAGGGTDGQINHDGSFCGGFTGTVNSLIGGKFRYLYVASEGWDGVDSNYPAPSLNEYRTRFVSGIDWIARNYPACGVQAWTVANAGGYGNQGSAQVGAGQAWQRIQAIIREEIEPINLMVISNENSICNEFVTNHLTQGARVDYIRTDFRAMMAAELAAMGGFQTLQRGPVLARAGTLNVSARTFTIPFSIASGANLVMLGVNYNNPNRSYDTASPAEIANTVSAFLPGQNAGNGKAIQLATVSIDNSAKTITGTLAGSSGILYADGSTDAAMPSGLSINIGADFGSSNGTFRAGRGYALADDRIGNGIPYGWQVRPALDIAVS